MSMLHLAASSILAWQPWHEASQRGAAGRSAARLDRTRLALAGQGLTRNKKKPTCQKAGKRKNSKMNPAGSEQSCALSHVLFRIVTN